MKTLRYCICVFPLIWPLLLFGQTMQSFQSPEFGVYVPNSGAPTNSAPPYYQLPADAYPGGSTNWTAGVEGGITNRQTIYTNLTSTASAAQINTAILACPTNQVVFLNAGTYTLSDTLTLTSYMTLRGATNSTGVPTTILNFSNFGHWAVVNFGNIVYPVQATTDVPPFTNSITSTILPGMTNITLASSPTGLITNQILVIDQVADETNTFDYGPSPNSPSETPHDNPYCRGGTRAYTQFVKVTGIVGNTIYFWPPIYGTYWTNTLGPGVYYWTDAGNTVRWSGIENITLNRTANSSSQVISFSPAIDCWAKNVTTTTFGTSSMRLLGALFCEVDDCNMIGPVDDDSAGAYNIYATQLSACKFENDYAQSTPAFIAPATMSGCVIAYNYATNITYSTANYLPEVFNLSHGGHCYYNLVEGNVAPSLWADAYHGNSSHTLFYRNASLGWESSYYTSGLWCYNLDYHNDYETALGNILGTTNIQTSYISFTMSCGSGHCVFNLA